MRRFSALTLAAVLAFALAGAHRALAATSTPDAMGCGMSGGSLTLQSADNSDGDFAVFGLYDKNGDRIARQYVPVYSSDASGEIMLTPMGFGQSVASVKCLAETSVQRCGDSDWAPAIDGVNVGLTGFLLGDDFAIVSVRGRYASHEGGEIKSLDGSAAGFILDKNPVQWSEFFDAQSVASQAFFALPHGTHSITIGWRDPEGSALVPQDRICFKT